MSNRKKIIAALAKHGILSNEELSEKSGMDSQKTRFTIGDCRTAGLLENKGRCELTKSPLYAITGKGREWLGTAGDEEERPTSATVTVVLDPKPDANARKIAVFLDDLGTLFELPSAPTSLTKAFLLIAERLKAEIAARAHLQSTISGHCRVVSSLVNSARTPTSLADCDVLLEGFHQQIADMRSDYHSTGDILGELTGDFDNKRDLWELAAEVRDKLTALESSDADDAPHPLQLIFDRCIAQAKQESAKDFCDQYWVDLADRFGVGFLYGEAAQLIIQSRSAPQSTRTIDLLDAINHVAKGLLYESAVQSDPGPF